MRTQPPLCVYDLLKRVADFAGAEDDGDSRGGERLPLFAARAALPIMTAPA